MGTVKISLTHEQFLSLQIHFLEEILGVVRVVVKLVAFDSLDISMRILPPEKLLPEILGQGKGSIISTWQHESIEQLFNSKDIASLQISRCPSNIRSNLRDSNFNFFHINFPIPTKLNYNITSHDFCQRGKLSFEVFPLTVDKRHLINIINRPALG